LRKLCSNWQAVNQIGLYAAGNLFGSKYGDHHHPCFIFCKGPIGSGRAFLDRGMWSCRTGSPYKATPLQESQAITTTKAGDLEQVLPWRARLSLKVTESPTCLEKPKPDESFTMRAHHGKVVFASLQLRYGDHVILLFGVSASLIRHYFDAC